MFFYKILFLTFFIFTASAWELKIQTMNLGAIFAFSSKTKDRISKFCQNINSDHDVDIVLVQEVWMKSYREHLKSECKFPFVVDLNESNGLKDKTVNELKTKFFKLFLSNVEVGSGLMILSRYPIVETKKLSFSVGGSEKQLFDGEFMANKGAIGAIIKHPVIGNMFIANTHLIANYTDHDYDEQRLIQLRELFSWFYSNARLLPSAIGGDFNISPPGKGGVRISSNLWKHFVRNYIYKFSWPKIYKKNISTFIESDEGILDHIFGINNLVAENYQLSCQSTISDHCSLITEFRKINLNSSHEVMGLNP